MIFMQDAMPPAGDDSQQPQQPAEGAPSGDQGGQA